MKITKRWLMLGLVMSIQTITFAQTSGEVEKKAADLLYFAEDLLDIQAKQLLDTSTTFLNSLNSKTNYLDGYRSEMEDKLELAEFVLSNLSKIKKPVKSRESFGVEFYFDTTEIRKKAEFVIFCGTITVGHNQINTALIQLNGEGIHFNEMKANEKNEYRTGFAVGLSKDAKDLMDLVDKYEKRPYGGLIEIKNEDRYYTLPEIRKYASIIKDSADSHAEATRKAYEALIKEYQDALGKTDKLSVWQNYIGKRCCWSVGGGTICSAKELASHDKWFFVTNKEYLTGWVWEMSIYTFKNGKLVNTDHRSGYGYNPPNSVFR
ncbi:MAG TPA: hypothetical protein VHK91_15920 [Flavisolibacter sp.]|nr:hypothetical protein [Flavisolibacter sp.]